MLLDSTKKKITLTTNRLLKKLRAQRWVQVNDKYIIVVFIPIINFFSIDLHEIHWSCLFIIHIFCIKKKSSVRTHLWILLFLFNTLSCFSPLYYYDYETIQTYIYYTNKNISLRLYSNEMKWHKYADWWWFGDKCLVMWCDTSTRQLF